MIYQLKKEITEILSSDKNNLSITFVGSSKYKDIKEISDIDIVVICKNLTKKYYQTQINNLKNIDEKIYKKEFEKLYINNSFGPLKYNSKGTLVLHIMIYDIKSHKQHVIESPFTCLDWLLYKSSYGPNLKELYPVLNLQIHDFKLARRSFSDYSYEFENKKLSYREYKFTDNKKYIQIKKYKDIDNLEFIEFMNHIIKFSLFNLCKLISNKNKIFSEKEVFEILPNFLKFKALINKLDRSKTNLLSLDIKSIEKEFRIFLDIYNTYLNNLEKKYLSSKVYFIRHSKTVLNDDSFLGIGRDPDIKRPLSKSKETLLKEIRVDKYFTSPLKRSINTARQVTNTYEVLQELVEINYGKAEGLNVNDLSTSYPNIIKSWSKGRDVKFPSGENMEDVKNRIISFLNIVPPEETVMAFTHQVVIRVAICLAVGASLQEAYKINIEHEKPYEFFLYDGVLKINMQRQDIYKLYNHD
tara:strand:+ start:20517 stop:21926 length:1410 start_codon:yes stop_codon:yes gene_type:complete